VQGVSRAVGRTRCDSFCNCEVSVNGAILYLLGGDEGRSMYATPLAFLMRISGCRAVIVRVLSDFPMSSCSDCLKSAARVGGGGRSS